MTKWELWKKESTVPSLVDATEEANEVAFSGAGRAALLRRVPSPVKAEPSERPVSIRDISSWRWNGIKSIMFLYIVESFELCQFFGAQSISTINYVIRIPTS